MANVRAFWSLARLCVGCGCSVCACGGGEREEGHYYILSEPLLQHPTCCTDWKDDRYWRTKLWSSTCCEGLLAKGTRMIMLTHLLASTLMRPWCSLLTAIAQTWTQVIPTMTERSLKQVISSPHTWQPVHSGRFPAPVQHPSAGVPPAAYWDQHWQESMAASRGQLTPPQMMLVPATLTALSSDRWCDGSSASLTPSRTSKYGK